jgi:hypothetical protein
MPTILTRWLFMPWTLTAFGYHYRPPPQCPHDISDIASTLFVNKQSQHIFTRSCIYSVGGAGAPRASSKEGKDLYPSRVPDARTRE